MTNDLDARGDSGVAGVDRCIIVVPFHWYGAAWTLHRPTLNKHEEVYECNKCTAKQTGMFWTSWSPFGIESYSHVSTVMQTGRYIKGSSQIRQNISQQQTIAVLVSALKLQHIFSHLQNNGRYEDVRNDHQNDDSESVHLSISGSLVPSMRTAIVSLSMALIPTFPFHQTENFG